MQRAAVTLLHIPSIYSILRMSDNEELPDAKRLKPNLPEDAVDDAAAATAAAVQVQRRSDGKKYVGKGSLVEAELIKAKHLARSKNPEDMTAAEKKEERRIANRLSAFQSRQRRKAIIEDLHKTVAEISKENTEHRKNNAVLQAQLDVVTQENTMLRQQFAVMAAAQAAKTAPAAAAEKSDADAPKDTKKEGDGEDAGGEGDESNTSNTEEGSKTATTPAAAPAAAPTAVANNVVLALLGAQMMQQQQPQNGANGGQPADVLGMLGKLLQPAAVAPAATPVEATAPKEPEEAETTIPPSTADV